MDSECQEEATRRRNTGEPRLRHNSMRNERTARSTHRVLDPQLEQQPLSLGTFEVPAVSLVVAVQLPVRHDRRPTQPNTADWDRLAVGAGALRDSPAAGEAGTD